jgi:hypothetical protein
MPHSRASQVFPVEPARNFSISYIWDLDLDVLG